MRERRFPMTLVRTDQPERKKGGFHNRSVAPAKAALRRSDIGTDDETSVVSQRLTLDKSCQSLAERAADRLSWKISSTRVSTRPCSRALIV